LSYEISRRLDLSDFEQDLEPKTFEETKGFFALTGEGLVKDFEAIKQFIRNYTKARIIYQKMGLEYLYITKQKTEEEENDRATTSTNP